MLPISFCFKHFDAVLSSLSVDVPINTDESLSNVKWNSSVFIYLAVLFCTQNALLKNYSLYFHTGEKGGNKQLAPKFQNIHSSDRLNRFFFVFFVRDFGESVHDASDDARAFKCAWLIYKYVFINQTKQSKTWVCLQCINSHHFLSMTTRQNTIRIHRPFPVSAQTLNQYIILHCLEESGCSGATSDSLLQNLLAF